MKTERTNYLKTLINKTPNWIKVGVILILPSPIIGLAVIGWGINKLLKSRISDKKGDTNE